MGRPDRDLAAWWPRLLAQARALLGRPSAGPTDRLDPRELAQIGKAVSRLSLGLTRARGLVGERYLDDPLLLCGYLLFYWPVSYAQVRQLLGELPGPLGPVLDLGSGPAPASFACLDAGAPRALAADRSGPALKLASGLAQSARGKGQNALQTQAWSPSDPLPQGRFGTIVAQHLLNELGQGEGALAERTALCRQLLDKLTPGGTLLLIEPALRDTSRELLRVRDALVRQGYAVRAPCLWRGDCQAIDRPSDWCHAERDWDPPASLLALAHAAGLTKDRLKMSYLALAPAGESWSAPPPGRLFRIVSEPLHGKGRARFMGCGPEGRLGLALQDKHVTEANAAFGRLERGEVVRLTGAEPKGDGIGLAADSTVESLAVPGQKFP